MSGGEFAAIEARANAATEGPWVRVENVHAESWVAVKGFEETRPITHDAFRPHFSTSPADYGRANAEFVAHAREDIPALLAAVRERDNTIARVRDIVESVHVSDDLDPDGYQVAGLIRAALDRQEAP